MATESPMRIVESSGGRKWASSRDSATFVSSFSNMAADELGLLLEGHKVYGNTINTVPNRSGSAPPSIEGSLAAFGDLFAQQSSTAGSSLSSLNTVMENYQSQSEEELRASPSYLAFYFSNLNLNPRLPPPIISRENKHLIRQNGGIGNNWRSISLDDSGGGTLHLQKYPLSTHDEEPEEEKLPLQTSDHAEGSPSTVTPETNITSLAGRHKSLVDLIQEDFPRTPSPVYTQSRSPSHATTDEQNDHDIHAVPLEDSSVDSSKSQRSGEGSVNAHVEPQTLVPNASRPTATSAANAEVPSQRGVVRKDVNMGNKILLHVTPELDTSRISIPVDDSRNFEQNQYLEKNLQQQQQYNLYPDRNAAYQVYGSLPQVVAQSQGGNHVQPGMEQILHAPSIFPSVEIPPVMQPRGPAPPLYATAAGFSGTPFYPSLSPTGMYAPQYGVGGYPMNSSGLTHYIAGYPSHAMPVHFDATSGQNFNSLTSGVATGDVQHLGGLQQLNKFYGQHGSLVQPSFLDPFQVQYFQHPVEDPYAVSGQYGRLPSTGIMMGQVDFFDSPKESNVAAYMGDQNFQTPPNNTVTIGNQRKGGMPSSYYGTHPTIGVMSHFSASPLGSPLLPGSPVGGANHFGRRSEIRFPQSSFRDVGGSSGWQGQRVADTFNDAKKHSFLEELKSSNARKFELSDIAGRIVEFSVDQHGSRFIQQKLENSCAEDKASVFKEVFPHASKLMTDVFGNYVIQKFFEHGSHEQRRELADQLRGQMLNLSLQMYGCRVIQKALEVIDLDQKTQLVHELDGHVMKCVRDQNGNHVIQKCIECLPTENIGFVISSFRGQVSTLSTHPYGCRVIQRVLEHCGDESQSQCIVDEILESAYVLAQDQYGNYVTQHVLERGRPQERSRIISKLTGNVVQLSQHKYASNVVEKCLEYGDSSERELLIEEILGHSEEADNLLIMMKDQFANYVVQKILEISNDRQRETLLSRIGVHLNALKKYTYGKHIVARFEQLSGEDSTLLEPLT